MCGIVACIRLKDSTSALPGEDTVLKQCRLLDHRGPDDHGVHSCRDAIVAHTRLSIVDVKGGHQPMVHSDETGGEFTLVCNGEIYNHSTFRAEFDGRYSFQTKSDSEVVIPILKHGSPADIARLNGMFAFVLSRPDGEVVVARDCVGIKPLVYGVKDGLIWFASELKALVGIVDEVRAVEPGHYWTRAEGFKQYYFPKWHATDGPAAPLPSNQSTPEEIFTVMETAVRRRLMADVPLGCFVSGGLDSSLVAAMIRHILGPDAELHTFSVAVEGGDSGDRRCSKLVSEHINSIHHEATFTVEEGIKRIEDVIYHLESWDVTPIRSGVAMSFLCDLAVKHVKVCLTGEGADEVWAGYLYFGDAKDGKAVQDETVRKVKELHSCFLAFDDRLGMRSSLELRVPFLDEDLLEYCFALDPRLKMHDVPNGRIEKHILREACERLLPKEVAWRRKEQFADGVGYSWIDSLKAHWEKTVSDQELAEAQVTMEDPPKSKEALVYRRIFDRLFPERSMRGLVAPWFPWSNPDNHETSGREQKSHKHQE